MDETGGGGYHRIARGRASLPFSTGLKCAADTLDDAVVSAFNYVSQQMRTYALKTR